MSILFQEPAFLKIKYICLFLKCYNKVVTEVANKI